MQHTYAPGDNGYNYPEEQVPVEDVVLIYDPSLMGCTHNYSCPVCRENHAVLDGSTGVMGPCWSCKEDGWEIIKVDNRHWWKKLWS